MVALTYKTSFTTGGLYYHEAPNVAKLYLDLGDWNAVRREILSSNLLQTRTRSSSIRTARELCFRLEVLSYEQLKLLSTGSPQEQMHLLWLASCKQYSLVREFAIEVVREKFLRLDLALSYLDFDIFFNAKAEWDNDLAGLTDSTRKKLRQVLFRMMREAEILDRANNIQPVSLTPDMARVIINDDPTYSGVFPVIIANFKKQATA